ncbi:MAG: hypothetical protein PHI73_02050 [Patescibacteria group bacterium]|nr:hypothetical protein [Patescibacteria group bacterium]
MQKTLEKKITNLFLFLVALSLPWLLFSPVVLEYAERISGHISQPALNPWSDAFALGYLLFSTVFNGFGLYRVLRNRSLPRYIPITTIVAAVLLLYGLPPIKFQGAVCDEKDTAVVKVSQSLQDYYKTFSKFPDLSINSDEDSFTKPYLKGLSSLFNIESFSNADTDEFFVYFTGNCKLRIVPNDYKVYPKIQ